LKVEIEKKNYIHEIGITPREVIPEKLLNPIKKYSIKKG
jgi:hypothetical protein